MGSKRHAAEAPRTWAHLPSVGTWVHRLPTVATSRSLTLSAFSMEESLVKLSGDLPEEKILANDFPEEKQLPDDLPEETAHGASRAKVVAVQGGWRRLPSVGTWLITPSDAIKD